MVWMQARSETAMQCNNTFSLSLCLGAATAETVPYVDLSCVSKLGALPDTKCLVWESNLQTSVFRSSALPLSHQQD